MYDKEKLLAILIDKEFKTVDDNGNIFPPSHVVYHSISTVMEKNGSHIKPKHVYTILKSDRNGMYSAVLKAFSLKRVRISNESADRSYNLSELNNSGTIPENIKFKLIISDHKWSEVKPVHKIKEINKRKYVTLHSRK